MKTLFVIMAVLLMAGCSTNKPIDKVAEFCASEGEYREVSISVREGNSNTLRCDLGRPVIDMGPRFNSVLEDPNFVK